MLAEGSADFELPVTTRGVMRLTPRIRETYLTPQTNGGTCIAQAVGTELFIWLFSDRGNIRLALPQTEFRSTRPYQQSVHRWGVSIGRFLTTDDTGEPSIALNDAGEKPTVEVCVTELEYDGGVPDVQ